MIRRAAAAAVSALIASFEEDMICARAGSCLEHGRILNMLASIVKLIATQKPLSHVPYVLLY